MTLLINTKESHSNPSEPKCLAIYVARPHDKSVFHTAIFWSTLPCHRAAYQFSDYPIATLLIFMQFKTTITVIHLNRESDFLIVDWKQSSPITPSTSMTIVQLKKSQSLQYELHLGFFSNTKCFSTLFKMLACNQPTWISRKGSKQMRTQTGNTT